MSNLEKTKGEPKVEPKPKTEQELTNEFVEEYKRLCDKHGFNLVAVPAFKGTNHGTFEVVIQLSVGRTAST